MKKIFNILLFVLLILTMIGCDNTVDPKQPIDDDNDQRPSIDLGEAPVYKYTFNLHDENTMPIGAWSDPPPANFAGIYNNPDLITDEQYRFISESGINVMYGLFNNASLNIEGVLRSLDHAQANNVVYLVRDHQITGAYDDDDFAILQHALSFYKDHPAFGGVMVVDEPGVVSYPNLGNLHKNFRSLLPNASFYINMLPNYASKIQLVNGAGGGPVRDDTITYERYMREFIEIVQPGFYSYDFYPFTGMTYGQMRSGHFAQMSQIRAITLEYGIPFWVFIQASSFNPTSLRVPYEAEVAWQVSTSLAYGAKGIQYFMYYTSMESHGESFVGGMVDSEGNKNPMYYYVQTINQHISFIDHILMNSVHLGVIVHGSTPDVIPMEDRLDSFSVLDSVTGDDALIGAFNYQGKPVLYVVNNNLHTEEATITLTFTQDVDAKIYNHTDLSNVADVNTITLTIPAGRGVLVELVR
jgi:hypothetical protein